MSQLTISAFLQKKTPQKFTESTILPVHVLQLHYSLKVTYNPSRKAQKLQLLPEGKRKALTGVSARVKLSSLNLGQQLEYLCHMDFTWLALCCSEQQSCDSYMLGRQSNYVKNLRSYLCRGSDWTKSIHISCIFCVAFRATTKR